LFSFDSALAIYPVWKGIHHLPVYEWPLAFPFSLSLYNYLFYDTYSLFLRLVGATGAGIMTWGRFLTPFFALAGAIAQWKLVQGHLNLRGARSLLSLLFALGLWLSTSIVRHWALSIRPDMGAMALVMVALYVLVRSESSASNGPPRLRRNPWSRTHTGFLPPSRCCSRRLDAGLTTQFACSPRSLSLRW
jgi:hypothetical protein